LAPRTAVRLARPLVRVCLSTQLRGVTFRKTVIWVNLLLCIIMHHSIWTYVGVEVTPRFLIINNSIRSVVSFKLRLLYRRKENLFWYLLRRKLGLVAQPVYRLWSRGQPHVSTQNRTPITRSSDPWFRHNNYPSGNIDPIPASFHNIPSRIICHPVAMFVIITNNLSRSVLLNQ